MWWVCCPARGWIICLANRYISIWNKSQLFFSKQLTAASGTFYELTYVSNKFVSDQQEGVFWKVVLLIYSFPKHFFSFLVASCSSRRPLTNTYLSFFPWIDLVYFIVLLVFIFIFKKGDLDTRLDATKTKPDSRFDSFLKQEPPTHFFSKFVANRHQSTSTLATQLSLLASSRWLMPQKWLKKKKRTKSKRA